jgi:hypothetical protein
MAIIYIDKFETALTGSIGTSDTLLPVDPAQAAKIRAAFEFNARLEDAECEIVGAAWQRLPLIIDNGSAIEWVEATFASAAGIRVVRGASPIAWSSGATVRCAPPAGRIAEGHHGVRNAAGGEAYGVPGETVAWAPTGSMLTLRLPARGPSWYDQEQAFRGDTWPMRIVVKNDNVARMVMCMSHAGYGFNQIWFPGVGMSTSSFNIPDTATWAVIELTKIPLALRTAGAPCFTGRLELF